MKSVSIPSAAQDALAAARAVAAVAAPLAAESDRLRRLAPSVVAALRESGLLGMALLRRDGGPELPLQAAVQAVRTLAAADSSAAWYAAVSSAGSAGSWSLPAATAADIWRGDPGTIVGGSARLGGTAEAVPGGVRVLDGHWEWGSAGNDAAWMLGTVALRGGEPVAVYLPVDGFVMERTWEALGLRASASHAFHAVAGTLVPQHRVIVPGARPEAAVVAASVLARGSIVSYQSALFAAIALGNASGALAELHQLAVCKTPVGGSATLAQSPFTWRALGRATALRDAAEQLLQGHVQRLWDEAEANQGRDRRVQAAARAAFAEAAVLSADIVQTCFDLAGASAAFDTSPLQRRLRDARVINQHYYVSARNQDLHGRLLLAQPLSAFEEQGLDR